MATSIIGNESTLTALNNTIGSPITLSINQKLDYVRHRLFVRYAGKEEELFRSSTVTVTSWTPSLEEFAALMPDTNRISVEFILESNSEGEIGSYSLTHELVLPAAFAPALGSGWVSFETVNEGAAAPFQSLISSHSRLRAVFDGTKIDCSQLYGAELAGFFIVCGGTSFSEPPYETGIIRGETKIICAAVDSRGQISRETVSIVPEPWSDPTLSLITAARCDASGSPDEDGNYCSVSATLNYSSVKGENSGSMSCAYRHKGGDWGEEQPMPSGSALLGPFSPDVSLEIRISGRDALGGSVSAIRSLPTREWAMKFREDGRGVAFGKAPETERKIELHEAWGIQRGGEHVYFSPEVLSLSLPASGWAECRQSLAAPVKAEDVLILDASAESAEELESFSLILRAESMEGAILFTASEPPETDLKLKALILRR